MATAGHFTSFPFGDSATAQKALDHNFAVQVQGTIQIATAGTYTFNVTSSDGFQLSIGTQTFTGSSTGTTYGSTMTYSGTRTTADSLGVTTFTAAGTYPIDLYYFNGATDARGWNSRRRPAAIPRLARRSAAITYNGTTATVTCPSHGYYTGEQVQIAGAGRAIRRPLSISPLPVPTPSPTP